MTPADLVSSIARLSPIRGDSGATALNDLIFAARSIEGARSDSGRILQMLLDADADPMDTRAGMLAPAEREALKQAIQQLR